MSRINLQGIGMTSPRPRFPLIERLRAKGTRSADVLEVMRATPRHIFLDEAPSHRAYEASALPICFQQTLSHTSILARLLAPLLAEGLRPRVVTMVYGPIAAMLVELFPTSGRFWKIYIEQEMRHKNYEKVEKLFQRSLMKVLNIDLWKTYLHYVKETKSSLPNYK